MTNKYNKIKEYGYQLQLRDSTWIKETFMVCSQCGFNGIIVPKTGKYKCDVDSSIVHFVHINLDKYDKFSFITNDGDYLVVYDWLQKQNKLKHIYSPDIKSLSKLVKTPYNHTGKIIAVNDFYEDIKSTPKINLEPL